tara:strand:- start:4245 stop:4940 length:696 start_codon:yes stop_codon:yes gene_type:complete
MATDLSTLRSRARTRADAVGNSFFSDSEIDRYINVGLGELHDILVQKFEDYYVTVKEFSLISGQTTYSFDELGIRNFYKSLGVDATDSGETIRVRRFSFAERDRYAATAITGRGGYTDYQYQIRGDGIEFIPEPNTTSTIKLWYVPAFSDLEEDDDEINSFIVSNWEEYAVITAVYKMKEKEELSTTVIERELEAIRVRIEEAAANRDAGESEGVSDEMTGTRSGWLRAFR